MNARTGGDGPDRNAVQSALRSWRDSLVNLDRRNRLLNFRATKSGTVEIMRPSAQNIITRLAAGKDFRLRSLRPGVEQTDEEGADSGSSGTALAVPETPKAATAPPPPAEDTLDTLKEPKDLGTALRALMRRSNQDYLDRGLWVLHLAIGWLTWVDVDDKCNTSPLLLVPVRLVSPGPRQQPRLELAEEDPTVNPALAMKLSDFAIELPQIGDLQDIEVAKLLAEVGAAVADRDGWEIDERVALSYFSFHNEAMYRDLGENEAKILDHPVAGVLAGRRGHVVSDFDFDDIPDDRIDQDAPPETTPLVLDADSSQRAAVAAALSGRSFVLDGPPGSGKSQTIANMIGVLLHAGRSVLFVSEKAAALEVVKKRLTLVGLDAYLLELHSHKATRKEVAQELGRALEYVPQAPNGMGRTDLVKVQKRREQLDRYAEAMNVVREPLGYSLHTVLGMIATFQGVPAAPVPDIDPAHLTTDRLGEIRAEAQALSRAWGPAEQGESFAWRGATLTGSADSMLYTAGSRLTALTEMAGRNERLATALGLTRPSQAESLAEVLAHLTARPAGMPDHWLTAGSPAPIGRAINSMEADLKEVAAREEETTRSAGVRWDAVPADAPALDDSHLADLVPAALTFDDMNEQEAVTLGRKFADDTQMLRERSHALSGVADMLGLPTPTTFADAEDVLTVAALTGVDDRPERAWLSAAGFDAAQGAARTLRGTIFALVEAEARASAYYTPATLAADVDGLAHRFQQQHHGVGKLRGEYRADRRSVNAFTKHGVDPNAALANLGLAVAWKQAAAALATAEMAHAHILGGYYSGRGTDFARLDRALSNAATAVSRTRGGNLTRLADHVARDVAPNGALIGVVASARSALHTWREELAFGPRSARPELLTGSISGAAAWLDAHTGPLRAAAAFARQVSAAVGRTVTVGQARHIVSLRARTDTAHARLAERAEQYSAACGTLYVGRGTRIDSVWAALRWAVNLRTMLGGTDAPFAPEQVEALATTAPADGLADAAQAWAEARQMLLDAFDSARQAGLGAELDDYERAASFIAALNDDPGGIDEWRAYVSSHNFLAGQGLSVVVEFCRNESVGRDQVPPVIERALLQGWADRQLAGDQSFKAMRGEDRDALVEEYRRLDQALVASATGEIIRACNARRPRQGSIGGAGLIRAEARKKRKHMPVRELLRQAGTAVQKIKPCFMMSPLAVSQFLPPELTFDVVIFDEASQVLPAEAINCIYRGSAFIAAGDDKQLPPTNFFHRSNGDDDDEWSEDSDDVPDYDSLIDLAKASSAIRSLTLRWHYRSRHEALIAFSNTRFYSGKLITFPGAKHEGLDLGVELILVDGTYRRGSSRDNPVEAQKVAERVIHHYDTRPTLTLGVVAFSEAQVEAIHAAVERVRLERPDLDRFFTDDRLDGFFVKSLESVQGDERDVMIFSIGYGPDENGKLTMNFGPLNKAGGWRRLNVAVTRARYRNEIVASIRAGDISASNTSEGVRNLRHYLDFAERGMPALALDVCGEGDTESPFEDSVLSVIRSWGYDVTPQVGTAGYRIDLAVHHPGHPGVYVLGVECDGYQYHSSRAARDRDRIRKQVLHGLGWHLHRIWGTAWYRNRKGEEDRLRTAIEKAVTMPVRGLLGGVEPFDPIERPDVTVEPAVFDETPGWTASYRIAKVPRLPYGIDPGEQGSAHYMVAGITSVVKAEGPIHTSILQERLRGAWGIGRVGQRIQDNIYAAIKKAGLRRDGDFVMLPNTSVTTVRLPSDRCRRRVDQVHDDELALALVNLVGDAGGISVDELTELTARMFGWGRRGSEISARMSALIERLLADRTLRRTGSSLVSVSDRAPIRGEA